MSYHEITFDKEDKYKVKTKRDIVYDLYFPTDVDRDIAYSIIDNLERQAAEALKAEKIVLLPNIGRVNINKTKREFAKKTKTLITLKHNMDKESFVEYARGLYYDIKDKNDLRDKQVNKCKHIKLLNKKKYNSLRMKFGVKYANCYILCLSLITNSIYDEEFEEQYNKILEENE